MFEIQPFITSEGPRVEWKQSIRDRDVFEACCALANDIGQSGTPGYLLLGVNKRGCPVGLHLPGTKLDDELQRIDSWLRSTVLLPTPSFAIHVAQAETDDKVIVVVEVQPYPVPPVVEYDGRAWVRPATSTVKATMADLSRLKERRPVSSRPFDARPVLDAGIDDLDIDPLVPLHTAERLEDGDPASFPAFEEWLSVRRSLGEIVRGTFVPTAAALLAYGKSPQSHFPGAFVDVVRYLGEGVDAEPAWRKIVTGQVGSQISTLLRFLEGEIRSSLPGGDVVGNGFIPDYPIQAIDELVRNLVQHRLYEGTNAPSRVEIFDGRIELSNPGGPFGRASEDEFGAHSDYRNPALTAILVDQGYVRQLGRGVRRARSALEKNGNPPLGVEIDGFTRVILWARTR